ncbi:hypothetical protein Gpo141_00003813 [Globisporangium polare]
MSHGASDVFGGASNASRRAMWKRQVAQQQPSTAEGSKTDRGAGVARISLPNGEQIHDISKLYEKRCVKDEQRKAHRFMREGPSRTAREPMQGNTSSSGARQPLDPEFVRTQKLNDTPEAYYNTDCGSKKTLQRSLEDATNPCLSAFSSTKERFASTAAYRASTFASVSTNPEAIGPGTYRSKKRAIQVKKSQVPTPSYLSKAARFEDAKAQVSAVLSGMASVREGSQQLRSPTSNDGHGNNAVFVRIQRPDCTRGPLLSTTPRFKSQFFPERYVSSKELRLVNDSPDRFYNISPSCKYTIEASVKSSSFRCSTMQSRATRLSSEAAMVHNTPNCPILPSPTKSTVGPGAYNVRSPGQPSSQEDMNFIMMPQHVRH